MGRLRVTIIPANGINYIQDASFAFAKPIWVIVEDAIYNISKTTVANLQCMYSASEGKFSFQNNFDGIQRVQLMIKT